MGQVGLAPELSYGCAQLRQAALRASQGPRLGPATQAGGADPNRKARGPPLAGAGAESPPKRQAGPACVGWATSYPRWRALTFAPQVRQASLVLRAEPRQAQVC